MCIITLGTWWATSELFVYLNEVLHLTLFKYCTKLHYCTTHSREALICRLLSALGCCCIIQIKVFYFMQSYTKRWRQKKNKEMTGLTNETSELHSFPWVTIHEAVSLHRAGSLTLTRSGVCCKCHIAQRFFQTLPIQIQQFSLTLLHS